MMTAVTSAQVLGPGAGWAVVLTVGIAFSFFMMTISWAQERYTRFSLKTNEEFNSASRSVQKGLISAAIVSAWVWAATILQSSTTAFEYGVSGPYWYGVGGTFQILIFANSAAMTKLNAPYAHTFLQAVRVRWGTAVHLVAMFFALMVNTLVSSMLVLGGSATVHQLTGMPVIAAVCLTPLAVAMYTLTGGLRSTFLADYIHTTVLMAFLLMFGIYTYAVSDKIGGAAAMYELLKQAPPIEGNADGLYTTFRSHKGLKFAVYIVCSGFSAVYADQSYYQRGIAAKPTDVTVGFILGGWAWFAVPAVCASSLGLAARALMGRDPAMAVLTSEEVYAGLTAPAAAVALMGKSGAIAMLVLLYLAVTSATSAQLIAVSSILTYDVWNTYVKPNSTQRQLFICSHIGVAVWAVACGILGCIWHKIGVSLGYLFVVQGILVTPAVFPFFACLGWRRANRNGALAGMLLGITGGVSTWLGIAKKQYGKLNLESTGATDPTMYGCLVSILVGAIVTMVWSYIWPDNYTFEATRAINAKEVIAAQRKELEKQRALQAEAEQSESEKSAHSPGASQKDITAETEKADPEGAKQVTTLEKDLAQPQGESASEIADAADGDEFYYLRQGGINPEELQAQVRIALKVAVPMAMIIAVFIPCMAITMRDFGPRGLGAWVGVMIIWLFLAAAIVVILPVWESRHALLAIAKGIKRDIFRR